MIRPLAIALLLAPICSCGQPQANDPGFSFLERTGDSLETTHGLRYRISAQAPLKLYSPSNRTASFNDVPFEISLSAYISPQAAVMVHAERVADGSHASDYTRYPESGWPDGRFRLAPSNCMEVPPEEVDGEHDLEWLRERGFDPVGPIYLTQYFASTDDFNEEIVISFLVRVSSCDQPEEAENAFLATRNLVTVEPVK